MSENPTPPHDETPPLEERMGQELLPPEGPDDVDNGTSPNIGIDLDELADSTSGHEPDDGPQSGEAMGASMEEPRRDGPSSLEAVFDVPVRVQAVLGRARMPISELVAMHPGHVFELDRRVGEPIDILVNDRLIARGEIVMIDGSLGVTLTEIVKQDS